MEVAIAIIAVFGAGIYMAVKAFKSRGAGARLREWAQKNNLKYQEKVKFGFINSESAILEDLVWGEYNGKRIYIFKTTDKTGDFSHTIFYFNGNFYPELNPEDIDQLLVNKNYLEQATEIFGNESETEMAQILVSQVYLQFGNEINYDDSKRIYKLLLKFYSSTTSLKDKLVGDFTGRERADIKYNSPEAISFVLEKDSKLERNIVENIANAYETLLDSYNQEDVSQKNPL